MAGTLKVGGSGWSAPSGLFYWVVDTLARQVDDQAATRALQEVSEHNLGWLDLADLDEAGRRDVLSALLALPGVAERELPHSAAREDVLQQVRELAALVNR